VPVSFTRLRIAGFKSFAEPANVEIRPGLTGIVGPNGCGKSNVVEALRWAMGESSARSLRGGEMEDVIFAGTTARPARNIAEVTLTLDDTAGVAPPPFHEQPELEVIRRIERGNGSSYHVNGNETRARDVQTLFADLASGAHSSAMVSQGRVGTLVSAKPEQRRVLLEEAAGITGLHARRHEAELKLRAAEANLARAEDLRAQLETQLAALKRQARQASRYRNISGAIRTAESELLAIQRAQAEQARAAAQAALHDAGIAVAAATAAATDAQARAAEAQAALPALREAEAAVRTGLERHRVAQEQIAAEESRARAALADAAQRLAQLGKDLGHATQLRQDADVAAARLTAEDATLAEADAAQDGKTEAAAQEAAEAGEAVRLAEIETNRATEAAAEAAARAQTVAQMLSQAEQRTRRVAGELARLCAEHDRLAAEAVAPDALEAAEGNETVTETALADARVALEQAEQARSAAQAAQVTARDRQATTESVRARLAAEARALADVLSVNDGEQWPPMVDALSVPAGLETALGAALGEELSSAADLEAARHWRELPPLDPLPALPVGATGFDTLVQGPPTLARALGQIGLVDESTTGDSLQSALQPGQMLVSEEGAVWRWDGYTIRGGTPTAAAVRLQQRNRLNMLRGHLADAEAEATTARQAHVATYQAEQEATAAEQRARTARREAEQAAERARASAQRLRTQATAVGARLAAVGEQIQNQRGEHDHAVAAEAAARAAQAELQDLPALRSAVERSRGALSQARGREAQARGTRDSLAREQAARTQRRAAIARELTDWGQRAGDAAARVEDLAGRRAAAETEHAALAEAPAQIAARRAEALDTLEAAEAAHRREADALTTATTRATEADRAARSAESALAAAREAAVRAEGVATQANHAWGTVAERILERLGVNPAMPDAPAELTPETEEKARKRLERLLKEREEMGPVNLRAEVEAEEVEKQITTLDTEREELTTAIAKLRGSIGHLNREGRERLQAVFQQIDTHFQALFARMFGGGRAHLAMVGSDDPLEAGLEIYAQPPGKKLATLSLLSGGEQALTALSLIFAVFRCNPAPVSVLDEVDAPLDDANVERFCNLLDEVVRETGTRFLVVTHHPMTMARMDRLYGVTMQERGVSQVLSVDLQVAANMVDPPRLAAE
jgi:chromosome segregation protein